MPKVLKTIHGRVWRITYIASVSVLGAALLSAFVWPYADSFVLVQFVLIEFLQLATICGPLARYIGQRSYVDAYGPYRGSHSTNFALRRIAYVLVLVVVGLIWLGRSFFSAYFLLSTQFSFTSAFEIGMATALYTLISSFVGWMVVHSFINVIDPKLAPEARQLKLQRRAEATARVR